MSKEKREIHMQQRIVYLFGSGFPSWVSFTSDFMCKRIFLEVSFKLLNGNSSSWDAQMEFTKFGFVGELVSIFPNFVATFYCELRDMVFMCSPRQVGEQSTIPRDQPITARHVCITSPC
jgi:hypothetical protein